MSNQTLDNEYITRLKQTQGFMKRVFGRSERWYVDLLKDVATKVDASTPRQTRRRIILSALQKVKSVDVYHKQSSLLFDYLMKLYNPDKKLVNKTYTQDQRQKMSKPMTREEEDTVQNFIDKKDYLKLYHYFLKKHWDMDRSVEPNQQITLLIKAVDALNVEMVQFLLMYGASIDLQDNDGKTALLHAIEKQDIDMVKLLLDYGASVNTFQTRGAHGMTALLLAIQQNNRPLVKLLLDHGALINEANSSNMLIPLLLAVEKTDVPMVRLLLSHGASPKVVNYYKDTPMLMAIRKKNPTILELLFDHGAVTEIYEKERGRTSLMMALVHNNPQEMIQILLSRGGQKTINYRDNNGETALAYAVQFNGMDIIQLLLDHHADIKAKEDLYGRSILDHAFRRDGDIVEFLLDQGAVINRKTLHSALSITPHYVKKEIFEVLLRRGANAFINDVNKYSFNSKEETPLIAAVIKDKNKDILELFLQHGANINAQDKDGNTALMLAIKSRPIDIIEFFIDQGASLDLKNKKGDTALTLAKRRKDEKILELVLHPYPHDVITSYLATGKGLQKISSVSMKRYFSSTDSLEQLRPRLVQRHKKVLRQLQGILKKPVMDPLQYMQKPLQAMIQQMTENDFHILIILHEDGRLIPTLYQNTEPDIVYKCQRGRSNQEYLSDPHSFYILRTFDGQRILIPKMNLPRVLVVYPTKNTFRLISKRAIVQQNYVSALHCQEGSEMQLYLCEKHLTEKCQKQIFSSS